MIFLNLKMHEKMINLECVSILTVCDHCSKLCNGLRAICIGDAHIVNDIYRNIVRLNILLWTCIVNNIYRNILFE
jgi:hypothetical protein